MFPNQTFVFLVIIGSIWFFDGSAGLSSASDGEPIPNDNSNTMEPIHSIGSISNTLDHAELSPTTMMPPKPPSDLICESGKLAWKTSFFKDVASPNSKGHWLCEVPKLWEGYIIIQKWLKPSKVQSSVGSNDYYHNQEE